MALTKIKGARISSVVTCVPSRCFDNLNDASGFSKEEVRKVVGMAGVKTRRLAENGVCSSDLCIAAARESLDLAEWKPESVDGLIMVTQTPDYFLPSTSCVVQKELGLSDQCAAFDVGLGCSGYPYGLWLAGMMIGNGGFSRVLLLHGETPTRFSRESDRSVALLFGDAGSATALEIAEKAEAKAWFFSLHTDGSGYKDLIIEGGGFRDRFPDDPSRFYVSMNGANIFNFTLKRVPPLIENTLTAAGESQEDIDYFIFHQSNRFIMQHLAKKVGIPKEKMPLTIEEFGSTGGPSVPLTITQGNLDRPADRALRLLLVSYGVGLSWGSALVDLEPDAKLKHVELAAHGN